MKKENEAAENVEAISLPGAATSPPEGGEKRALVLGGKLQGVDAAYLMKRAGYHVTLVDRDPACAARELADAFVCGDLLDASFLRRVMAEADIIIPALEKLPVLETIDRAAKAACEMSGGRTRLMFSLGAYQISSSKLRSDAMFERIRIPAPRYYPDGSFPLIAKPSGRSGSEGVMVLHTPGDLIAYRKTHDIMDCVIQEYVTGPSYSIEVIRHAGRARTFAVTDLVMDEAYDCKRVVCPSRLAPMLQERFAEYAKELADAVNLEGIMDVECILSGGVLYVLEIDARIPSQTLTAVYQETGVSAPAVYADGNWTGGLRQPPNWPERGVIYEHIAVKDGRLTFAGEHIMGGQGPLHFIRGFYGADEVLTTYEPGKKDWVATLILTAPTRAAAWTKQRQVIERILAEEHLAFGGSHEDLFDIPTVKKP